MSLDVKVLFGSLNLVTASAFSSRTEALQMVGYSPGYPVNASENGDFNLSCECYPIQGCGYTGCFVKQLLATRGFYIPTPNGRGASRMRN